MERKRFDRTLERRMLTGLITSDRFLREMRPLLREELVDGKGAGRVIQWCIDYWDKYQKAPSIHIQDIYDHEASQGQVDSAEVEFIERLLIRLSKENEKSEEQLNVDYLLDQSIKYLKLQSLRSFVSDIQDFIEVGDPEGAEARFKDYKEVSRTVSFGIDPVTDPDVIREAFEQEEDLLFSFPGALGKMINHQLRREALVGFMAPEKRGKSFWLTEIAMRAYRNRKKVVLFEAGDMGRRDRVKRIQGYLNQRPVGGEQDRIIKIPFLKDEDTGEIGQEERKVTPLSWREAYKGSVRWSKRMKARGFKMFIYENSTLTVSRIKTELDRLEYHEDYVPDVVIIDYADIMAPEDGRKDFRHQQNETWKALRALSQHYHCCVITATQTDSASYGAENIGLKHFSEDKRKYAHVTAMYALNQTEAEKAQGILRIGQLLVREGSHCRQVKVLQCLDIGRPYISSCFVKGGKE